MCVWLGGGGGGEWGGELLKPRRDCNKKIKGGKMHISQ